ncbi:hypothetical protein SAMN05443572_106386 [Myxococcus fulvus]|uniref:Lipoprotein n=1 Tax=Myxococcus fulvus TaxID=33 RepID=A0ABY1CMX7_MYXFU|nr:hypothetical protein SAMN05443572_106386 [Myxococcus fulvus]
MTRGMWERVSRGHGASVLLLWLGLGSTAALAVPIELPVTKGTVLVEKADEPGWNSGSVQRLACEGRFCLWLAVEELGACSFGYCSNMQMWVSDLEGRFLGASHGIDDHASRSLRFVDPEHVEVVTWTRDELFHVIDTGLDPLHVNRRVMKVSRDGARFIEVPGQGPGWTMVGARAENIPGHPKPPKPRTVSGALLERARALCPKRASYEPVEYVCRDGMCLLLLSGFKANPDGPPEDATWMLDGRVRGPLCVVLVQGKKLTWLSAAEDGSSVELLPDSYRFWGGMAVRGGVVPVLELSRTRPGYMVLADTVGAVVHGSRPYPVRIGPSAEAALALAPTVQAFTQAQVTWGLGRWKDAADLAFAWRLARVEQTLVLQVEVHDETVVPRGTGTGVHSDHLELTLWQHRGLGSPRPETRKLGVLLGAGGEVEVRDWTAKADVMLPFLQGTWRERPQGYEVTLVLPWADLGMTEPLTAVGFVMAVSDADVRGKQETLMEQAGGLNLWSEYPPTILEYSREFFHQMN